MHRLVRDKELREFCLANKISIIASSTIGGKESNSSLNKLEEDGEVTADQVFFTYYKWCLIYFFLLNYIGVSYKSRPQYPHSTRIDHWPNTMQVLFRWAYEKGAGLLLETENQLSKRVSIVFQIYIIDKSEEAICT